MSIINFPLHPKQWIAFTSKATEVLYGGAAGSAKSHLMRVAAIMWCLAIPGLQCYLFRRIYDDLIKNHMEGPTGFHALLAPWLGQYVDIVDTEIRFNNGSKIYLCHCQHEKDRFKYQGAEIHVLLIDELTHFTEVIYRFLRSRVRMPSSMEIPEEYKGCFPRILCGTNPGGIGHQFVKTTWIEKAQPFEIYVTNDNEGGFKRQFIPARLEDNPSIDQISYRSNLSGLGNEALVKAMLEGDWDIVSGAALNISRALHLVRAFTPPRHWTKFQSMDWGYVKPFSVGWYCVVEGSTLIEGRNGYPDKYLPNGAVVRYRELYGWNGKPDEGQRLESPILARQILEVETKAEEVVDYRIADTQLWAKNDGPSMAERMLEATKGKFNPNPAEKDRQANYAEICNRLKGIEDESGFIPMFYITDNCLQWWRTVPPLVLDDLRPERGPGEGQEAHCLTPDTLISTIAGDRRLDGIITGDLVLTTDGYKPAIQLGKTQVNQAINILLFSDGYELRITSDHKLLTSGGVWLECNKLRIGDKLCRLSSGNLGKNLMDYVIGFWGNTMAGTQRMGSMGGSIELYGNIITALFQKIFTFITRMKTGIIIRSKILNLFTARNMLRCTCGTELLIMGGSIISPNTETNVSRALLNGINLKMEKNGIASKEKEMGKSNQGFLISALCVMKNILPAGINRLFAAVNAPKRNGELTILSIIEGSKNEVWNLHVPGPNNYILANGIVSHNCYDETAYGLISRPFVTTREQRIDRVFYGNRAKHKQQIGESADPYRLRHKA